MDRTTKSSNESFYSGEAKRKKSVFKYIISFCKAFLEEYKTFQWKAGDLALSDEMRARFQDSQGP